MAIQLPLEALREPKHLEAMTGLLVELDQLLTKERLAVARFAVSELEAITASKQLLAEKIEAVFAAARAAAVEVCDEAQNDVGGSTLADEPVPSRLQRGVATQSQRQLRRLAVRVRASIHANAALLTDSTRAIAIAMGAERVSGTYDRKARTGESFRDTRGRIA